MSRNCPLPVRIRLNRWGAAWAERHFGTEQNAPKLIAVWRILVAGLMPLLVGLAIQTTLRSMHVMTPLFDQLVALFWKSVVYGALLGSIAGALLNMASWRDKATRHLTLYPALIALSAAGAGFVAGFNNLIGTSHFNPEAVQSR